MAFLFSRGPERKSDYKIIGQVYPIVSQSGLDGKVLGW